MAATILESDDGGRPPGRTFQIQERSDPFLKIARRITTATLAAALLCSMPFAEARTQTIEATGVYQMGENDTIATAKENANKYPPA